MNWTSALLNGLAQGAATLTKAIASAVVQAVSGLASRLAAMIQAAIGSAFNIFKGALSALGIVATTTAKILTGALVGGIGAVAAVSIKAVQSFTLLGQRIRDLSAATGLSPRQSGAAMGRFGALGVDAGQMFGDANPGTFGMRAAAFGLPNFTQPGFAPALAGRYQSMQQSGPFGAQMARNLLSSLGIDNEQGRRLASTPVASINRQLSFQSRVQSTLGVDPEMIARVSQEFGLLGTQLRILGKAGLNRLAAEILPRLNGALEVFVSFAANNAGRIGELITGAVDVGFNALAGLIEAIPALWQSFINGITAAQEMASSFIGVVLGGFDTLVQNAPAIWDAIWNGLLKGVDIGEAVFNSLKKGFGEVFTSIEDFLGRLMKSPLISTALGSAGAAAAGVAGATGAAMDTTVLERVHQGTKDTVERMGVPSGWSDLTMLAGLPAASWAAKSLISAIATGGGGGAMGFLTNPGLVATVGGTAAGVGAGYLGYKALQSVGLVDREQGFWDRMETGVARLRGLAFNGDMYAIDKQVNAQWAAERNTPKPLTDTVNKITENISTAVSNAPHGNWRKSIENFASNGIKIPSFGGDLGSNIQKRTQEANQLLSKLTGGAQAVGQDEGVRRLLETIAQELRGQTGELKNQSNSLKDVRQNTATSAALAQRVERSSAYLSQDVFVATTQG